MANVSVTIKKIETNANGAFVIILNPINNEVARFVQNEAYTRAGIAVTPYGAVIYDGTNRASGSALGLPDLMVGDTVLTSEDLAEMFIYFGEGKYTIEGLELGQIVNYQ